MMLLTYEGLANCVSRLSIKSLAAEFWSMCSYQSMIIGRLKYGKRLFAARTPQYGPLIVGDYSRGAWETFHELD